MMDCAQLREFYEEFALGALEGPERDAIAEHLARKCPVCTPGVERAQWLVSQLALAAPQLNPPAAARERVLQAVAPEAAPNVGEISRPGIALPERPTAEPAKRNWFPVWVWLPAAAAILFAVYTINQNRKLQQDIAQLDASLHTAQAQQQALQTERARYARAMIIMSSPQTHKVMLKPSASDMPMLSAYVHAGMGVVIDAQNVPMPPTGRGFQLWMVPKSGKGVPVSMGMYMPDKNGNVLTVADIPQPMDGMAALAVTEEPSAGSAQPTSKPMWVGALE